MKVTEATLGARIAAFRKKRGYTQEQLAAALGVSSPAVSKWETGNSCPDITLLCPLARALDTNVDTLLQFEETLSEEQLAARTNEVIETARTRDIAQAEAMLWDLLHQFPSSIPLKYYAATVLTAFEVMFPPESQEKKEEWKRQKKELLQQVRANGASSYWQQAILHLASLAVADDELEQAEQLLKELPEHNTDPTLIWSQLHMKRDENGKALEVIQKRLYVLIYQVQTCLMQMMSETLEPDADRALEICEVYRAVEELFGCGGGMSAGAFAEIYKRMDQKEKVVESLNRLMERFLGPAQLPKPLLFSRTVNTKTDQKATTKEWRNMFLQALKKDESLAEYRERPDFQAIIETLQQSLSDES